MSGRLEKKKAIVNSKFEWISLAGVHACDLSDHLFPPFLRNEKSQSVHAQSRVKLGWWCLVCLKKKAIVNSKFEWISLACVHSMDWLGWWHLVFGLWVYMHEIIHACIPVHYLCMSLYMHVFMYIISIYVHILLAQCTHKMLKIRKLAHKNQTYSMDQLGWCWSFGLWASMHAFILACMYV